jgi:hypothetical protein
MSLVYYYGGFERSSPMSETAFQIAQDRYSTSTSRIKVLNYSTSTNTGTVTNQDILNNLPDLINPDYKPWFSRQLRLLGYDRFMELANKARAASDTPQRLFRWMIQNNELVK